MVTRSADVDGLTGLQVRAVIALAGAATVAEVARAINKSEATIYRWIQQPAFRYRLTRARRSALELGLQAINGLVAEAVDTLRRCLMCGVPAVEVRAAVAILDKAVNGQALSDLAEEVEALREALTKAADLADSVFPRLPPTAVDRPAPPVPAETPTVADPTPAHSADRADRKDGDGSPLLFPPAAG